MHCLACGAETSSRRTLPAWIESLWRKQDRIPCGVTIHETANEVPMCEECTDAETYDTDTVHFWERAVRECETYTNATSRRPILRIIEGGRCEQNGTKITEQGRTWRAGSRPLARG